MYCPEWLKKTVAFYPNILPKRSAFQQNRILESLSKLKLCILRLVRLQTALKSKAYFRTTAILGQESMPQHVDVGFDAEYNYSSLSSAKFCLAIPENVD